MATGEFDSAFLFLLTWGANCLGSHPIIGTSEKRFMRENRSKLLVEFAPLFEEAIRDVGIFEQTAEYLSQKFAARYCWAV
ncbi:MAG: hypothetical protein DME42_12630 [Verrucomicrobia bacterium]|nr:MAG: hypothetical protein DME42_12630 [Verrucomicrobiota bacterium]